MKALEEMSMQELWQLFPIELKPHRRLYRHWYEEQRAQLGRVLPHAVRISHIGSTAVPGLVAKPIVDILLELPAYYEQDTVRSLLEHFGWIFMCGDAAALTMSFNKGYTPAGFAEKVYHLHVRPSGDWDELYFRDYLTGHDEVAGQYARLKSGLKERYEHDRDAYTAAKAGFVAQNTQAARAAFGGRYCPARKPISLKKEDVFQDDGGQDAYYYGSLGWEALADHKPNAAIEFFLISNAMHKHFKTYERLYECYQRLGDGDAAYRNIQLAYAKNNHNDKTAYLYAVELANRNQTDQAKAVLQAILSRNHDYKKARTAIEKLDKPAAERPRE